MSVQTTPAALWTAPWPDAEAELGRTLAAAPQSTPVFFRADDVALPSRRFARMVDIFRAAAAPCCLAVVPTWLPLGLPGLRDLVPEHDSLFDLSMHGFRHVNHEAGPKKMEFGPARSPASKRRDLLRGRELLERHLGAITPLFTPPWNKCDAVTLGLLHELGFAGVSRWAGKKPPAPPGLGEVSVNVDLHTRPEPDAASARAGLLTELAAAARTGTIGVMLHHQRLNAVGADFLRLLLGMLTADARFRIVAFPELLGAD